jgi:NTE family protein
VAASASIPGFFPPLEHHELVLNDGSVCCPVPVKYAVCQEPCIIVACGVPPRLDAPKPMDNAVEIMIRCEEINHYYLTLLQMSRADVQIYPEIGHVEWNEFDRMDELVEAGREAGRKALPQIRDVVQEKGSWLRRRFGRQTASRIVCERPLEGE